MTILKSFAGAGCTALVLAAVACQQQGSLLPNSDAGVDAATSVDGGSAIDGGFDDGGDAGHVVLSDAGESDAGTALGDGGTNAIQNVQCWYTKNGVSSGTPCQVGGLVSGGVDPSQVLMTWTTTEPSDSAVHLTNAATGTTYHAYYDPALTRNHSILINPLYPDVAGLRFYVSSCTTPPGDGTPCPMASANIVRAPARPTNPPYLTFTGPPPIAAPQLAFEAWHSGATSVFQGSDLFIVQYPALTSGGYCIRPETAFNCGATSLPSGIATGTVVVALDGVSATDCSQGGGNNLVACQWNGAQWASTSPVVVMSPVTVTLQGGAPVACAANVTGDAPCGATGVSVAMFSGTAYSNPGSHYLGVDFLGSANAYGTHLTNPFLPATIPTLEGSNSGLHVATSPTTSTGKWTISATFQAYTDGTLATPLGQPVSTHYAFMVEPLVPLSRSTPAYSAMGYLPTWYQLAASSLSSMCFDTSVPGSIANWEATDHYMNIYFYSPFSWGDYPWNYDNGRQYKDAAAFLLTKPDGASWGSWSAGASFGTTADNVIILPTANNPNGFRFVAQNIGGGTSGATQPDWNSVAPDGTIHDGSLIWKNIGNRLSFNRCSSKSGDAYVDQVITNGATGLREWSTMPGNLAKNIWQTGDSTQRINTPTSGLNALALRYMNCPNSTYVFGNTGETCDTPDHPHMGQGLLPSSSDPGTFRTKAYALDAMTFKWLVDGSVDDLHCQAMFNQVSSLLNAYDAIISTEAFGNGPKGLDGSQTIDVRYDFHPFTAGLTMKALIAYYDAQRKFGGSAPCAAMGRYYPDERIPVALKRLADFMWMKWWDMPGRAHWSGSYVKAFAYQPLDVNRPDIAMGVWYNGLNNLVGPVYAWLYAQLGSGSTLPDGTGYDQAFDSILQWHFATPTGCGQPAGGCTGYLQNRIDFSSGMKNVGQTFLWGWDGLCWRLGTCDGRQWGYLDDWMAPDHNRCWDGSNGSLPCTGAHPFADAVVPAPFNLKMNFGGGTNVDPSSAAAWAMSPTTHGATLHWYSYKPGSSRVDYGLSLMTPSWSTPETRENVRLSGTNDPCGHLNYTPSVPIWCHTVVVDDPAHLPAATAVYYRMYSSDGLSPTPNTFSTRYPTATTDMAQFTTAP